MRQFTDQLKSAIVELLRKEIQACKPNNLSDALAFSMAATIIERLPTVEHNDAHYHMLMKVTQEERSPFAPGQIAEILAMLDDEDTLCKD